MEKVWVKDKCDEAWFPRWSVNKKTKECIIGIGHEREPDHDITTKWECLRNESERLQGGG